MRVLLTKKSIPDTPKNYNDEADKRIEESSTHDKEYYSKLMIDVDNVMKNPPETWSKYPDTLTGDFQIVTMEFNEMRQDLIKNDHASLKMNTEHLLASALKLHERLENE